MDREENIVLLLTTLIISWLFNQFANPQRIGWLRRKWRVRPVYSEAGEYEYTYLKYKQYKDWKKFKSYTKMSWGEFKKLYDLLKPSLKKASHRAILPEKRLIITLRYLITGQDFVDLSHSFHIGISTVHKIVHETMKKIHKVLSDRVLKYPDEMAYRQISEQFWTRWNMPNCVGAIDGKHIAVQSPPNSGSQYFNYKGHFSIVLMAVCDAAYCFTMVDVGQYGSISDGGVFGDSELGRRILEEDANLPYNPSPLPNSTRETHKFFVADQTFPLNKRIMRPYPGENLSDSKLIFNYRLSRARGIIEATFGILAQRFKIFKRPIVLHDVSGICDFGVSSCVPAQFHSKTEKSNKCSRRTPYRRLFYI